MEFRNPWWRRLLGLRPPFDVSVDRYFATSRKIAAAWGDLAEALRVSVRRAAVREQQDLRLLDALKKCREIDAAMLRRIRACYAASGNASDEQ